MSPKDKTDRLIKTQQQPLSKLIMINKLQCSAFGLPCFVLDASASSRSSYFLCLFSPCLTTPICFVFLVKIVHIHSLKILWRFLCLLWRIWRAKLHPLTGCTVDMRIDCLGVGHQSTG